MTAVTTDRTPSRPPVRRSGSPGFGRTLHAEWLKFWTVRSTKWSIVAMFVLGAGLTVLVCATSADWLASSGADESPGSFVTWGMMFAQITAIVLGALTVTSEYGTGMIRATLAATPRRGAVLAAKALVLSGTLVVAGTLTAVAGYLGGNAFLDAAGVGVDLGDDGVLRSLLGSGLYMAGLGLLAAGVGLLVRHTAAVLSVVLALVFVVGNMAFLLPGSWGEWTAKLLPGNAGSGVATPVSFNPELLDPWTGFAVFSAEVAAVLLVGWLVFQRRDA
jgi:ABC-2 type transport system permease protein